MAKRFLACLAVVFSLVAWAGAARADFTISHSGAANPTTEGFGVWSNVGSSSTGPVLNDMGYDAWSMTGVSLSSANFNQYLYYSGSLSASQQADVVSHGFVYTVVERVQQGLAPVSTNTNLAWIGGSNVHIGSNANSIFEFGVGIDSSGNTVVDVGGIFSASNSGGRLVVMSSGGDFITLAGESYHTYQFVYNPATQLADFYIDGNDLDKNVSESNQSPYDYTQLSTAWGQWNGGIVNVNTVQLASGTPIPGTLWLFGTGLAGLIGLKRKYWDSSVR